MGLLRKAARAVTVDDTNASPPGLTARPQAPAGLLRRSLQVLRKSPRVGAAMDDLAARIIEEARAQVDGVELPSLLFTTLRKRLSILKGAILLYDPLRLEYAPWASCGFDQTTLHRLRIPLGANDTVNALAKGEPLVVTDPGQKSGFQRFFSSREFAALGSIVLTPFIADDSLVGVLLATEIRPPLADSARLLSCLKSVALETAPLLQAARGFLMKWDQAKTARPAVTPEDQIARLLESPASRGKKTLLLSLGMDAYVRGIAASHEDIDVFRLREDIRIFLDAFLADLGVGVALSNGTTLVCLQGIQREDIDLFLHQLRGFLGQHFLGAVSGIQAVKSRMWPDDGTDVREILSFFSS